MFNMINISEIENKTTDTMSLFVSEVLHSEISRTSNTSVETEVTLPPDVTNPLCGNSSTLRSVWLNASQEYQKNTPMMHLDVVLFSVILPVIMAIGLVGNTIIIIILKNSKKMKPMAPYYIALAINDNVFLISAGFCKTFLFGLKGVIDMEFNCGSFEPYWHVYVLPLMSSAMAAGVLITASVTITRFISVSSPLSARTWLTKKVNRRLVITVTVFPYVYNLYKFFYDIVVSCTDETDGTIFNIITSQTSTIWNLADRILIVTQMVLFYIVPCGLVFVFNLLLIMKLRDARKRRASMVVSEHAREQNRLNVMLIGISGCLFLCTIPMTGNIAFTKVVYGNLEVSMCLGTRYIADARRMNSLSALTLLNSSINFFWFMGQGTGFKSDVKRLLCPGSSA